MKGIVIIAAVALVFAANADKPTTTIDVCCPAGKLTYSEDWGYVDVRASAHMFWWLYYKVNPTPADVTRPLILWLQGGPGASSTGFGNFQELGPIYANGYTGNLEPRNTTWLQKGDLIFIDNPVGTGYSYVDDADAYTTTNQQIADDLVTLLKTFFNQLHPEYQTRPFYIFCESYGGKMSAGLAWTLNKAILGGTVKAKLQGVVLGDSWISPMDFVNAWGPYLYATNYLDGNQLQTYQARAQKCQYYVDAGNWEQATNCWSTAEDLVGQLTSGVSWYNILKVGGTDPWSLTAGAESNSINANFAAITKYQKARARHLMVGAFKDAPQPEDISVFMNGPIREKLGIIPSQVTWGGQSNAVFDALNSDFMKPVVDVVDNLLSNTSLKVVIMNGQLDLICCTMGVDLWMKKLKWAGLSKWNVSSRTSFQLDGDSQIAGFYKKYEQLEFYWIMRAGHMVAHDAAEAALKMIDMILS